MRTEVLGVGFDNITAREAVDSAYGALSGKKSGYVVTPNPEIVWQCRKSSGYRDVINGAFLVLPDGIGIIYGARILGKPLKSRVPGIDFISALFEEMAPSGKSVFLFGAKPGIAESAASKIAVKFPGLRIAGTNDGYFSDDLPIIEKINASKPDLLLVCLGFPKQELWMAQNSGRLNVRLMAGLGGTLDVFAGETKRAPEAMRKLGLEWLYRLIKEPRRIKRMIKLPLFIFAVVWQRIRGK